MSIRPKKSRVAIMISGRGSNMRALIKAAEDEDFPAQIVAVISDVPETEGLRFATARGVPNFTFARTDFETRARFEEALETRLRESDVDLICLAGFMRVLSTKFCERWEGKLLNIHPSLLPAFKGLDPHKRACEAGVRIHGCSVHFVIPAIDSGPIIIQAAVPVFCDDLPETLAARVLRQEHVIYPAALRLVASREAKLTGKGVVDFGNASQQDEAVLINPTP